MNKIAFIFPGQGSQYIGMGRDFYEKNTICKSVYELASKAGDLDVESICFTENDLLNITEYTQLALLATEVAMLKAVEEKGIKADVTAGLSLGEYAALVAAGVLDMKDAFHIIRQRGIYMQEAVPNGGGMTAVLGVNNQIIEEICEQVQGQVSIANYNCPGQTVITGAVDAVNEASAKLKEAGAKRCIPLLVSGPFHSPMLHDAGVKLGKVLEGVDVHEINIPYLSNVTADYVKEKDSVKNLLQQQVYSSVCWQQSVEKMIADGITTFIEIGPGKTLSGFIKKINKEVKVYNIQTVEDLENVAKELA